MIIIKKIIISLIILLSLTGCWDYKELNEYSIVTGVAIDKIDSEYEVSVLISNSSKNSLDSSPDNSQIVVYSGKGSSVVEGLKDIGLISPKELFLSSFSVVVISDEVAKDGINNVIDFFFRYSKTRKNFNIVLTKDEKAKDALKIITPLTDFPSENISDNLKSTTNLQGIVAETNFTSLLIKLLEDNNEITINSLSIVGDIDSGSKTKNLESSEPKTYIKLGNLGIFKDDKLIDWATKNESLGINIVNDKIDEMYLKINLDDSYVIVNTTDSSTSINTNIKNNKPVVDINVSGECKIVEVNGDIDLENTKTINKLNNKLNNKIKKYINEAINLAIENKSDIFGLGSKFYQNHPDYYKKVKEDWEDNLDQINFNINSNVKIKYKVSAKNSLEEEKNEK